MLRRALARRSAAAKLAAAQNSNSNDVGGADSNSNGDMWRSWRHSVVSSSGSSEGQLIVTIGGAGTIPPRSEAASSATSKVPVQEPTKDKKKRGRTSTSTSSRVTKGSRATSSKKTSKSSKSGKSSKSNRKSADNKEVRSSSRSKATKSRTGGGTSQSGTAPTATSSSRKGSRDKTKNSNKVAERNAQQGVISFSTKNANPHASATNSICDKSTSKNEDDSKSIHSHRTLDSATSEGNTTVSSITQTLALCPLRQAAAYPELAAALQGGATQPLIERTLACPPGPLSIQIRYCPETGCPEIDDVLASSPMACLLFPGDRILRVDDLDVRGLQCERVKQIMSERVNHERIIKVLSVVRTSGINGADYGNDDCEKKKSVERKEKKKRKSKKASDGTADLQLYRRLVVAPEGKVGAILRNGPSGPEVHTLKPTSPLLKKLFIGDRVVEVNGIDVSKMNAKQITKLMMASNKARERRIVVLSAFDVADGTNPTKGDDKASRMADSTGIVLDALPATSTNASSQDRAGPVSDADVVAESYRKDTYKAKNDDAQCSATADTASETTSKQSSAASSSEPSSSSESPNQESVSREDLSLEVSRDIPSAADTSSSSCNQSKSESTAPTIQSTIDEEGDKDPMTSTSNVTRPSSFAFEGRRKGENLHDFWLRRKQAMALGSTRQIETSSVLKPNRKRVSTEGVNDRDESSAAGEPRSTTRLLSATADFPLLDLPLSVLTKNDSAEISCRKALLRLFANKVKDFEGNETPESDIGGRVHVVVLRGPAPLREPVDDGINQKNRIYHSGNEWAVISPIMTVDSAKELPAPLSEIRCDTVSDIQKIHGHLSILLERGDHTSALNLLSLQLLPRLYEKKKSHGMMSREYKFCSDLINATIQNIATLSILFEPNKEAMIALTSASKTIGDIVSTTYRALAFYATENHARASHLFASVVTKIEKENSGRACARSLNNMACSLCAEEKYTEACDALVQALQALLYGRYSNRHDSVSTVSALVCMTRRQVISPFINNETEGDEKKIDLVISLFCNLAKVLIGKQEYADARECLVPILNLFSKVKALRNHPIRSNVMKINAEVLVTMEKTEEAVRAYEELLELLEDYVSGEECSTSTLMAAEEEIIAVCDDLRILYKDQKRGVEAVKCLRRKITHQRMLLKLRIAATKK